MNTQEFRQELNARIARHDLLTIRFTRRGPKANSRVKIFAITRCSTFIMSPRFRITLRCLSRVRNSMAN